MPTAENIPNKGKLKEYCVSVQIYFRSGKIISRHKDFLAKTEHDAAQLARKQIEVCAEPYDPIEHIDIPTVAIYTQRLKRK